jgi:hypothetical protein
MSALGGKRTLGKRATQRAVSPLRFGDAPENYTAEEPTHREED